MLKKAVAKYGKDAFTYEILHDGIIPELLDSYEIEAIKEYNTLTPNGYNLTAGGEGWIPSQETNDKRSKSLKGKSKSKEHRAKLSLARQGIVFSETHRKNMARNGSTNGSYRHDLHIHDKEICDLYESGVGATRLAVIFNAGETTIRRILKKYNVRMRTSGETQRIQNKKEVSNA